MGATDAKGNPVDPVGEDQAVMEAISALDLAMIAAAERAGVDLSTIIIAWVVQNKDGTYTTASMLAGDVSAEILEFAFETAADDACDLPMPTGSRLHS